MLAIEMSDARGANYASIHAAGCRDLRDGQDLPGEPTTLVGVANAVEMATGWGEDEYDADDVRLKPCAEHAMRKAAAAAPAVVEPVQNLAPDELPDVEPVRVTLGARVRALGSSDPSVSKSPGAIRFLAAQVDALQARADADLEALRSALAEKHRAEGRAAAAEARVSSLQAVNGRLNETIRHMITQGEANAVRLRVAMSAELLLSRVHGIVRNIHAAQTGSPLSGVQAAFVEHSGQDWRRVRFDAGQETETSD